MARTPADTASTPEQRIEDVDVASEMQDSFLEYAYSVIYSRALPDARDGLKPVQRRILYQMSDMGLLPSKGHVKSARVVGEVMGKLHPHGDSAIYEALVRMAQPWTMRLPLIDGHGNFGSLDDGPAASRYTEARLDHPALAMVQDLDEDVVDFVPNYDNQLQQPSVLPAAIPSLLVNGASGIAVGMATNMAPHNLVEVVAAARHLLAHPDATLDDLMRFVPAPDLPGGGTIIGLDGVREAYATGRGSFRTRARVSIESLSARKVGLVITELPYLVGPERVIEKIKEGVQSKKLEGIADVQDLTDRQNGLRLVITIKTGFRPEAVLEQLYRFTPLEESFGINNVALVDGQPRTLGLRELLQVFLDHRIQVVTRRSRYRLARRQERLHLVEGLLIAILDIDEVIQVIRTSDDAETARTRLQTVFDLSELQAEYILELRLRRLTKFSRLELEKERDQLLAEIAALELLLSDPQRVREAVSNELGEVSDRFGTPRRTLLTEAQPQTPASRRSSAQVVLEIQDAPCAVILSATGRLIRVDLAEDAALPTPARRSKHDAIRSVVRTTTRGELGAVTNTGRLIRFSPIDLPVAPEQSVQLAAGVRVADYLTLSDRKEVVLGLVGIGEDAAPVALGTAQGVVKRTVVSDVPAGKPDVDLIALKPGDRVVGVGQGGDDDELVFVTTDAQLLHFAAHQVRPQGRPAAGMAGIRLSDGATVLSFAVVAAGATAEVVTVSNTAGALIGADPGRVKRSSLADFPAKGRATGGVRAHAFLKGEDSLSLAWVGPGPALAVGADGSQRSLPSELAKRDASGTPVDSVIGAVGSPLS